MRFVRGTIPGFEGERDIAVIEGDSHLGTWTEENRRLDNEHLLLDKLAKHIGPDSVVYDLGANIGDHTSYFAALRPKAVVAWEAYQDAFDCLLYNMAPYRALTNLTLFAHPVGNGEDVELTVPITTDHENKGTRSVRAATGLRFVQTHRIDDLVESGEILPPTFMKIDIEGWEVHALSGAWKTVQKYKPVILCEVGRHLLDKAGNTPEQLRALFVSLGYALTDCDGGPWLIDDPRPGFDALAIPT